MEFLLQYLWIIILLPVTTVGGGALGILAYVIIKKKFYNAEVKEKEAQGASINADALVKKATADKIIAEGLILMDERENKKRIIGRTEVSQIVDLYYKQSEVIQLQIEQIGELKLKILDNLQILRDKDLQIERLLGINEEIAKRAEKLEEKWLSTLKKLDNSEIEKEESIRVRKNREETIKKLEDRVSKLENAFRSMGQDPTNI